MPQQRTGEDQNKIIHRSNHHSRNDLKSKFRCTRLILFASQQTTNFFLKKTRTYSCLNTHTTRPLILKKARGGCEEKILFCLNVDSDDNYTIILIIFSITCLKKQKKKFITCTI